VGVLVGVLLLVDVGPAEQVEAALDHPEAGVLPFAGEGELDQHRVPGRRLLARPVVPSERETSGRFHGLDHHGTALVAEAHVATSAGLDLQVHLVGEPQRDLVGLGDRPPHHLDGGLDQDVPLDLVLARAHRPLPFRDLDVQPKVARRPDNMQPSVAVREAEKV